MNLKKLQSVQQIIVANALLIQNIIPAIVLSMKVYTLVLYLKLEKATMGEINLIAFTWLNFPRIYFSSSIDRIFPAGSLNHAIFGPSPRKMPFSSVLILSSS